MATRTGRFARANQWLQFARQWHLIDANHQDVYVLGEKVARHLAGKQKPLWHPEADCGDHVVVVNCKDVAMEGFDWKHRIFHFDNQYPQGRADIPAYQIHEYDPCRVIFMAIYNKLGNNLIRRKHIQRLHLFPDAKMPEYIQKNIGNLLEQVQVVPRKSTDYTAEERAAFPRLVHFPEDHFEEWEAPIKPPGRHEKPAFGKAKDKK
ncbi:unnamed protein product, partial [Mesorhabditis belari]|uniref:39S ribosomal protein L13, mitochondrial n=1 Tax=Mesorhabditis belari TaxID=2138241 RepID=A0AAF3F6T4_9BILA